MIRSFDLKVTAAQRALDAVYNSKASKHHTGSILGSLPSRLSKSQENLDLKLSETQESLDHLIRERHRLQIDLLSQRSALGRRSALNSPTGNLPLDLWAQIFLLCLPDQDFIIPDPLQAPLLLCQVCSSWRTVATNTSFLWSNLSIRQSWRRHIWKSSLESWLTRSGNTFLQLDISITANNVDDHIFKLIVSSAERWYHLRISVTDQLLRSLLNRRMPNLHTLEFSSTYPIASLVIPNAHIPSLKSVSLLTKPLFIQPISLPWTQLTSLSSVCWLNVEQHLDIIRKCPNLEVYHMAVIHIDGDPHSGHYTPLVAERLKVLEIVACLRRVMGEVLSRLKLPSLIELAFEVPNESPEWVITSWPEAHVVSLIERSSCELTKLCLQGVDMSDEEMLNTEKLIPTLKSIEIL
ncbi:hypothetical protein M413DRAFT_73850 [Hebeloma cylindrosporum]|uniref:Uncharacterized protein n=1 Tax=Hebeloma cylindrosporum TaxID=76867 RepID=A0A0C3BUH6_HEBCY|nr:hypothetical protein M413DRAFT_73850 [Hebeloma cylindrosporum h7]